MAEPKFKIGDVVYLNSDKTINLTINELKTEYDANTTGTYFNGVYQCIWFDKTETLKWTDFKEETLTSAVSDKHPD